MAPEYGATMGFFPVDEATIDYFEGTGRTAEGDRRLRSYFKAQGLYGVPLPRRDRLQPGGQLDLGASRRRWPGPSGRRTASRSARSRQPSSTCSPSRSPRTASPRPVEPGQRDAGRGRRHRHRPRRRADRRHHLLHQHLQPGVLLAAGLLAKKAVERGLKVAPHIKTSLAPGSRVVTEYLTKAGLLPYLEQLGFGSPPTAAPPASATPATWRPHLNEAIGATTWSARPCCPATATSRRASTRNIKANFLASPPLVVAYAIAGTC
jgi:aconitate hydratase